MANTAEQAAYQVQERLKAVTKLVQEIEKERTRNEHTLNNITKTHDKITLEGKVSPYYQQKLKGLYTTAVSDAEQEEELIRQALNKIYEIRNICHERRMLSKSAAERETFRRVNLMNMLQSYGQTLPLWVGKPGEKVPPLCGAVPAGSNYIAKTGDLVAALVKGNEDWILAVVVRFNSSTNKYEVYDIDEEPKDRHTVSKRRVVPLPLMRANPETDPSALFPKGSFVMGMFPRTTCFYKAVVHELPQTPNDGYKLLFEDPIYPDGYGPPLETSQFYVIALKNKKGKSQLT